MEIGIIINKALEVVKVMIESPTSEAANQVVQKLSEKAAETIKLKTSDGIQIVTIAEIEAIDVYGEEMVISLVTGELIVTKGRLYKLKEELNDRQFIQISKSSILNLKQLKKLDNSFSGNMMAYLKSGKKQSVSRRYLIDLKEALHQL